MKKSFSLFIIKLMICCYNFVNVRNKIQNSKYFWVKVFSNLKLGGPGIIILFFITKFLINRKIILKDFLFLTKKKLNNYGRN